MKLHKHRSKKYYVIHQSTGNLGHESSGNTNIFSECKSDASYFAQQAENPFTLTAAQQQKHHKSLTSEQLFGSDKVNSKSTPFKLNTETIYKLNKLPFSRFSSQQKKDDRTTSHQYKMPAIIFKNSGVNTERNNYHSSNKIKIDVQKYNAKVQKYQYHHSLANQLQYRKDLKNRCGQHYFQQILRDRHKDQIKPLPYVYSLRTNIVPLESSFVKYVKKVHPSIKIRQKMILKGVNKSKNINNESIFKLKKDIQKLNVNLPKNQENGEIYAA